MFHCDGKENQSEKLHPFISSKERGQLPLKIIRQKSGLLAEHEPDQGVVFLEQQDEQPCPFQRCDDKNNIAQQGGGVVCTFEAVDPFMASSSVGAWHSSVEEPVRGFESATLFGMLPQASFPNQEIFAGEAAKYKHKVWISQITADLLVVLYLKELSSKRN